jgi:hypothetical protein
MMIGRAEWDSRMITVLIRNHNATHPGPPVIHVTQSVASIHTGAASDWGNYNDRKGAWWKFHVGWNYSMDSQGRTLATQYYSRGFCDPAESAKSSDCTVTASSLGQSNIIDDESKTQGSGVHVTKSGFVFVKR